MARASSAASASSCIVDSTSRRSRFSRSSSAASGNAVASVSAQQAADADRHVGEPSRGVEARAGHEAEVVTRRPARIAARGGEQRPQPGLRAAGADAREPLRDQRPVDPVEAHDVGHRAERDQVEQRAEVRLRAAGESAARAQLRPCGQQHVEHDADAGEMLARKRASGLIRIDDQRRRRKCRRPASGGR